MNKRFWATTFTLTGTIVGAGILGLPYVFSRSGILIGIGWLLILGLIVMFVNLCLGEVSLRTKGKHHLVGYAEKYLGKWGGGLMFFAVVFGIYSALIAYLIGESQSLSLLVTGSLDYAIYFAVGFWILMTLLLRKGLKGLRRVELWGVLGIIVIVIIIAIWFSPRINIENYYPHDFSLFFLPFGVILFSIMGFSSIPELRLEIKGSEKKFKKVIILGVSIPIIIYIIFSLVFVGVLGKNIPEVATLSFGSLVILLGVFTMFTSYFVLSFSLKDLYFFDLKFSKTLDFILVSIIPLTIYLVLYFFNALNFVKVLGIGGVISGGITGILVLFTCKEAKKKGNRKPEYSINLNSIFIWLISLLFVLGIIVEVFF